LTQTFECWDKSSVSVSGQCKNDIPTFTVTNAPNAMTGVANWRLLDESNGSVLTSGTYQMGASEVKTFAFPEYAGMTVRFHFDQRPNHPGSSQPNAVVDSSCGTIPTPEPTPDVTPEPTPDVTPEPDPAVYSPAGYCGENGVFGFSITHSGEVGTGVSFTVTDGDTVVDSGTLNHDEAASFNRTYTSISGSMTITVSNGDQVLTHTQENCYVAPQIILNGYCEGNGITAFSASINGVALGEFSYTITDENGAIVESGNLADLFNGKTYTGTYASLTLSVTGSVDPVSVTPYTVFNCYYAPEYSVDVYCADANGEFTVFIDSNGVTPLPGTVVEYEVVDANGGVLVARTAFTQTVYQIFTSQVGVTANLYVNGEVVKFDSNASCYNPPYYVIESQCYGT
ncbi:MAG TPA: hypothetical protein PLZ51_26905, partial [Aggregatilineales bacterium]|nr:hypothetical protein [Aggregatilineales bacterium]